MKLIRLLTLGVAATLVGLTAVSAQETKAKKARVSPPDVVTAKIGDNEIKISYGRPHTNDPKTGEPRKIWGGLVPYGQVWRTGANEATVLTLAKPIVIGGQELAAGKYSLFTVPTEGADSKLIINKKTGQWGIPYKETEEAANEVARVALKRAPNLSAVEQFTISIEPTTADAGMIKFSWADASYSVAFKNKN